MRKLPPLNALKAFEAAARHISFTKAGEELNVTHGAISRQVSLLEDWLSTALFHRSASTLALTQAGRSYAAEVTSLLDRLSVVTSQVTEQAAPSTINVSAPPTFTMRWLIPRISGFQRKRPGVEVRLTTSIAPVHFQENHYDVAIRGALEPLSHCDCVAFMTETIVPVCHADIVAAGRLRTVEDLSRQTLIRYATEPYGWPVWLDAVGLSGLSGASTLHFEQMYFALQAAAEGLGVVLVPLFLVADDIAAGRLCAPFGLHGAMERRYYANTSPASAHNLLIAEFRDWLIEEGRSTERSIMAWAHESLTPSKDSDLPIGQG
ncbi:transcriptional regulator GcvA [Pseudorhodoferax sp. Leaf265]|uniref:transcriptional regulator GcvA n=1 Tax=Pseudorhodoferax sp. Leaf265 TaxID=1736315 RepID=UPI000A7E00C6|nr:transcriptional regulator GcvA [Pseudorhodoferax sp. Leaf265]